MNIKIPKHLITGNSHKIDYSPLHGKLVVGTIGFARAGKDSLVREMVERLSFKRISFGDMLKYDLNNYMKNQVYDDLQSKEIELKFEQIDFVEPESISVKEILRPYMIWFGEEMKKINGIHHWTNRAFSTIHKSDKKIAISDVRRVNELEIFHRQNKYIKTYDTLLFYINQLNNTDKDTLTIDAVLKAQEQWLFDDTVFVDSRIPDTDNMRENHMVTHLRNLVNKFNILV